MVLGTARRGGLLLVAGRRTALLAAARPVNALAVLPRQLSSNNMPPKAPSAASRERAEFREARLPQDNIEFKDTGFLTTVDRLSNIMFMAEIFRALWLSAEVCAFCSQSFRTAFVRVMEGMKQGRKPDPLYVCVYKKCGEVWCVIARSSDPSARRAGHHSGHSLVQRYAARESCQLQRVEHTSPVSTRFNTPPFVHHGWSASVPGGASTLTS